jgi:hypothetical protein
VVPAPVIFRLTDPPEDAGQQGNPTEKAATCTRLEITLNVRIFRIRSESFQPDAIEEKHGAGDEIRSHNPQPWQGPLQAHLRH